MTRLITFTLHAGVSRTLPLLYCFTLDSRETIEDRILTQGHLVTPTTTHQYHHDLSYRDLRIPSEPFLQNLLALAQECRG